MSTKAQKKKQFQSFTKNQVLKKQVNDFWEEYSPQDPEEVARDAQFKSSWKTQNKFMGRLNWVRNHLNDESNTFRVASYVAFGVAGVAVIYSTAALINAAEEGPETSGRTEVVEPKLMPVIAPRAVGLEMRVDF